MSSYTLQTVLTMRERARDEAQDEVARCLSVCAQLDQEITQELERLEQMRLQREAHCHTFDARLGQGGVGVGQMQQFDDFVRGLRQGEAQTLEHIEALRTRRNLAQREAEKAQVTLTEAVTQLKAVEKHHQAWQEEQEKEQQLKQSAAMDEIAARRWRERNSS